MYAGTLCGSEHFTDKGSIGEVRFFVEVPSGLSGGKLSLEIGNRLFCDF